MGLVGWWKGRSGQEESPKLREWRGAWLAAITSASPADAVASLERSLRDQRPTPSDEFMGRMSSEISRRPVRRGVARPVLAFGLTAAVCVVFAGLGGIGYASSALSGVKSHVAPTNSKGVQGSGSVENSYPNRKFKVTLSPDHVKIDKPQSADFQVTVVPRHGFSGKVKCTASIKISEKHFTGTPPTVTPTKRTFTPPKTML